jgi:hypothetical protein
MHESMDKLVKTVEDGIEQVSFEIRSLRDQMNLLQKRVEILEKKSFPGMTSLEDLEDVTREDFMALAKKFNDTETLEKMERDPEYRPWIPK